MNFLDKFKKIVGEQPNKEAMVDLGGARSTTYQELAVLSGRIAAKLLETEDIAGQAVLVCMDRRMEYVAAEIGIMMAGGAYVPLLPEYPQERIAYIRKDCGAVCTIDAPWMEDIGQYEPAGEYTATDRDRALMIYTSGSTGRPKGIVHSHGSLFEGAKRIIGTLGFDKEERMAASAPLSFVASVMEYYAVLSSGGCTHMLSEEVRRDVRLLETYYAQKEITCGFISPQMLRYFKNRGKALKKVVTGSERVSMLSGDGYALYNLYGCSESALPVSAFKVEEPMVPAVTMQIEKIPLNQNQKVDRKALPMPQRKKENFEKQDAYPLTQTQNGIFVECAANPGSTIYNIPFLFRLDEKVELSRLKKAAEEAVAAHPYIKTTLFMDEKGDIWQKRNDNVPFEVEIKDRLCREELVRPYQLLDGKLFRIELYGTEEGNYLFLDFHHIISDGTSCGIFIRDMNASYGGEKLSAEVFSGFEAALVEQKALQGEEYSRAKEYYDSVFSGCDTDFLPARDKTGPASVGWYGRKIKADMDALGTFCKEKQITMNALFTAAFGFVIGRHVYKDQAVFATIYNGRNDSRLSSVISMLVKTLPVYCNIDGEQEIDRYLKETGEQLLNSMNADIYSFAEVSRAYGIKADILFAFQGDNFRFEEIGGEKAVSEQLRLDTAKAPLSVDVAVNGNEICYQAEYRSDMYEESTIAGLMDSLAVVIEEFCNKKFLKEVSMVSGEARLELDGYNETDCPIEQATANVLFERQADLHPDKTAVIAGGESRTFRELNENANKIANRLLEMGLAADRMVGMIMPRTADVYAVRQGIMKAGGAFVPIDPEYPDELISYILEDSGAEFVIMPEKLISERSRLMDMLAAKALSLEELLAEGGNIQNPQVNICPENLCYCIYTSGSTGTPKGVMIEHRNLVNYVNDNPFNREAQAYVHNAAVSLALAVITFDVSILEECIPLYHGITVCMANEEEIHNPFALSKLILAHGVDMMTCTPSFLINIIDMPEMKEALSRIKVFNVGAEAFPDALYEKIMALGTAPAVFNGYGPTETTIGCAFEEVTGEKITIGKPMANIKMMIIDKYRNLLPAGAPGELLIIGNGVGRGYVGKPEMTADKFITFEGRKAYRSGDLARWNHHGKIEFMGRMDNQVKLRGLRVELDEIENVMNQYPGVKSSVVLVKEKDANQFLCGYFVAQQQVDCRSLTCFMQKYLTPYMVPGVLMQLPKLPLTNNGKVDKRALPEPGYTLEKKKYVEPCTE